MKYPILFLISLGMLVFACSDPIDIGSEIIDPGNTNVSVDTIPITARIIQTSEVPSLVDNLVNNIYRVGNLEDDVYGTTAATSFFSATLLGSLPVELADENALDSVIMILGYDTLGRYCADNVLHDLELFQASEALNDFAFESDTLFSFEDVAVESTPIWSGQKLINHEDSLTIGDYIEDTLGQMIAAELRIALDTEDWTTLFASQTDSITQDLFSQIVPGFSLESSTQNSMIGLSLANAFDSGLSRLFFYYREQDTIRRIFGVPLGDFRHTQTIHNDTGSELATARATDEPDLLYLQPQGDAEIEIDLSEIFNQDPFILNSAKLELTVADPVDIDKPVPESLLATIMADGVEFPVIDFTFNNLSRFGGIPERRILDNGESVFVYTLDITGHINLLLDGVFEDMTLRISPSAAAFSLPLTESRASIPNRTRIFGPNHPTHPLLLKIITTRP